MSVKPAAAVVAMVALFRVTHARASFNMGVVRDANATQSASNAASEAKYVPWTQLAISTRRIRRTWIRQRSRPIRGRPFHVTS
jgi:hypothetical protein